jgi:hypothetical protein
VSESIVQIENAVVVYPTWRCGLSCPYCAYEQQSDKQSIHWKGSDRFYKVVKELTSDEWITLLARYRPAFYDFSGGEPLLYKGIEKVLNSLDIWSITSNTLFFNNDIDLSKCAWWTASFHPHAGEEVKDKFIRNIIAIKKRGVNVGITLVARPETVGSVIMWCNRFTSLGFKAHIHPYYDDPKFDWDRYPKEKEKLLKSPYLVYGENLFKFEGKNGDGFCKGGKNYFAIGPDGKVFSCLTSMLFDIEDKIGKDKCNQKCMFPCDWKWGGRK